MFKDIFAERRIAFRDTVVLDYDFQPKILQYRENEQMRFAAAIRPLLQEHNGRHLFVYGAPGVGKTTACRHVFAGAGRRDRSGNPLIRQLLEGKYHLQGFRQDLRRSGIQVYPKQEDQRIIGTDEAEAQ